MNEIQKWLRDGDFRAVNIKPHCHGVRVTLREDFKEVVTCVEGCIEDAFLNCLKEYKAAKKRLLKEERERLKKEEKELKIKLDEVRSRRRKFK